MNVQSIYVRLAMASMLVLASRCASAQDGLKGALTEISRGATSRPSYRPIFEPTLAIADFDNDDKPDGAVLLDSGPFSGQGSHQIELHFTNRTNVELTFQSAETNLSVYGTDIDQDGDVDLVVEQSITHKRLQLWLNNGHGDFEKGRIADFPSSAAQTGQQIKDAEELNIPAVSLPPQRCVETMLKVCHVAGRPPSDREFAVLSTDIFAESSEFPSTASRAPPLS
jgi:hypothetical protein